MPFVTPEPTDYATAIHKADHSALEVAINAIVVPAFAAPNLTLGTANAAGAASTVMRSDATIAVFDATTPVTQAFGDTAATGSAGVAARRDHTHGMPANPVSFAAPTIALGTAAAAGAAGTVIRSDATIVAFDATAPSTQAFGDAAVVGVATVAARRDHKHAMPAAPAGGMTLIQQQILGASASSVTFSAISGTYKALVLDWVTRTDNAGAVDAVVCQFNGDTTASYDHVLVQITGAAVTPSQVFAETNVMIGICTGAGATASIPGVGRLVIPAYAGTTFKKVFNAKSGVVDGVGTNMYDREISGAWRNTAAITQLVILPNSGPNFIAGSVFTLYGQS